AIASLAAQRVLRRRYTRLIARNPRHRIMLWTWLGVYAFIGIQMGWILRPFIGQPGRPVTFFREDTWGNAYIKVFESLWEALWCHPAVSWLRPLSRQDCLIFTSPGKTSVFSIAKQACGFALPS